MAVSSSSKTGFLHDLLSHCDRTEIGVESAREMTFVPYGSDNKAVFHAQRGFCLICAIQEPLESSMRLLKGRMGDIVHFISLGLSRWKV